MNLHRSDAKPEWADISNRKRTGWQHLAAATYGVATPGNFLTVLGFSISVLGLIALINGLYWTGLAGLAIGRLCDVADGWAADRTGTKSPIGEVLDAAADKFITFGSLIVLGITRIVPWWVLGILAGIHLLITAISLYKFSHGHHLHPSLSGKLSMASAWTSLVVFVLAAATSGAFSGIALIFGYALALCATVLGVIAANGYLHDS